MEKQKKLSIMFFSLFSAWMLSFPFEGQVLYSITETFNIDAHNLIFSSITVQLLGMIFCGFVIKTIKAARMAMLSSISLCAVLSLPFFFSPSLLWNISLMISAFSSGICIAAWGFHYKTYTPSNERIRQPQICLSIRIY